MKYNMNIGIELYKENEGNLVENFEGYYDGYAGGTEENKAKIREVLLDRKHQMENLNLTRLNTKLQDLFGDLYLIPDKWWMEYEYLENIGSTDEKFLESMCASEDADFGWQGAWRISPEAAQMRVDLIVSLMNEKREDIAYIKENLICAALYNIHGLAEGKRRVEAFCKESLARIRYFLYEMDRCPDFFDELEDGDDGHKDYITNRSGRFEWDQDKALQERGFKLR